MPTKIPPQNFKRAGLTLAELLVVLTILAITATVAVIMTEGVVEQARFDSTKKGLEEIRNAIVGPADSSEPQGFVADVGRPPVNLNELLTLPSGVIPHSVQSFDSDGDGLQDIFLASGWNGPYLRLGVNQTSFLDGWGRPFLFTPGPPLMIRSQGSDGNSSAPEFPYETDLQISVNPAEYQVSLVSIRVYEQDEEGLLKDPELESGEAIELDIYSNNGSGTIAKTSVPISKPNFQHQLTAKSAGIMAVRALFFDDQGSIEKKSIPLYLTCRPGAVLHKSLVLRPVSSP